MFVWFYRLDTLTWKTEQSRQESEKKEVEVVDRKWEPLLHLRMKWRIAFLQDEPDLCLLMNFYSPHFSSLPESAVAIHNAGDCHRINLCPCTSLTIKPSAVIHLRVMSPRSYLENIWGRQYILWWQWQFLYQSELTLQGGGMITITMLGSQARGWDNPKTVCERFNSIIIMKLY